MKRKLFVSMVELRSRGREFHKLTGQLEKITGALEEDSLFTDTSGLNSPKRSKTENILPYFRTRARSSAGEDWWLCSTAG